jgi:HK97 family phage major capsid protein
MLTKQFKDGLLAKGIGNASWTDDQLFLNAAADAIEAGTLTEAELATLSKSKTPSDVFGGVRLKKAGERYSTTKSVAKHAKSGLPVLNERGLEVETVSQLETVKAGVLFKKIASRSGLGVSLNEHENELLEEMFDKDEWCGKVDGEYKSAGDISGLRVKTLLNDSLSGGAEVVPTWFDDALISFPLLHSEILPKVDIRDVQKSASVSTASISNPTATWGVQSGTSISPFDTASLIAGIDTTIHNVSCAVEIGRDFLSDSSGEIGKLLLEAIGQRMLSELDRVIVIGNGVTEPQGIFNASGLGDIGNPAGGAGAVPQVDDYEALMFTVPKQYRQMNLRPAFFANDVTYRRARGIPVGASDERRVFGMTHGDYRMFDHPYVINNSIGNAYAGFGCLAKYRLYRRQAQQVQFTSEGRELALKNQTLLVVRGRFGGKVMDANAFAFSDNFQA